MARATDIEPPIGNIEHPGDIGGGSHDAFGSVGLDFGGSDAGSSGDDFDASIHVGRDKRNADGSYTKKRGRKSGSGGYTNSGHKPKTGSPSVNSIETSLIGIHAMMAAFTNTPELMLDADESKPLAQAVAEVAKHYDIPGLDAVVVAWVGLIMVCGKTYVPRAILINKRMKEEARPKTNKPKLQVDNTRSPPQEQQSGEFKMPFDPLNPIVM